jgi:hypothetical protein
VNSLLEKLAKEQQRREMVCSLVLESVSYPSLCHLKEASFLVQDQVVLEEDRHVLMKIKEVRELPHSFFLCVYCFRRTFMTPRPSFRKTPSSEARQPNVHGAYLQSASNHAVQA